MEITKEMIGKFFTRTGRCDTGCGSCDGSYIGDSMRLVAITDGTIHFRHYFMNCVVSLPSKYWNDGQWEIENKVPENGNGCDHRLPILAKKQFCYDCGVFIGHLNF